MSCKPVIAILDVGKTNKKLLVFDEEYRLLDEISYQLEEDLDESGYPCENLSKMVSTLREGVKRVLLNEAYDLRAVNFAAYGASLVYIDHSGVPLTPLYNYLKPYPGELRSKFYQAYGGETDLPLQTASPILGSLNSGMQVYRLKYECPEVFGKTLFALHLPQYLSFVFTKKAFSDLTSVGCHTNLWDFTTMAYHHWVYKENVIEKMAPMAVFDHVENVYLEGRRCKVGIGLHDSSAALIPYMASFSEPFALISTGTWCITMNPFNTSPLTSAELAADCLCYLSYKGNPVKASRLFAGFIHDREVSRIAERFLCDPAIFKAMPLNEQILTLLKKKDELNEVFPDHTTCVFETRTLDDFESAEEAYHQLIIDIVQSQVTSSMLVLHNTAVKRIFVDGGFGRNHIFMHVLAAALPEYEVFAASISQATALGAAISIHQQWNTRAIPGNLIELKSYRALPVILFPKKRLGEKL